MKRIFILIVIILKILLQTEAQIPNGGFETWIPVHHENIDFWQSYGNVKTAVPSHGGNYGVKLSYDQSYGGTSFLLHGGYDGVLGFIGGVPYNERPDSIAGYFKCYSPDPTDVALMLVIFRKNGVDLSTDFCYIPTNVDTSQYVRRSFKINFSHPTETPDSVIIMLTNPRPFQDTIYSGYLIADDVSFVNTTGAIPNGDFESWNITSYEEPLYWATLNIQGSLLGQYPAEKITDNVEGSYAIKIETVISGTDTIGGYVKSSMSNSMYTGAFPLGERITSMSASFKYFPANSDSAMLVMLVYHCDTMAGFAFTFIDSTIANYKNIYIPVNYADNFYETPDSAVIYLSAYNLFGGSPKGNSVLYIDDLQLHFNNNIVINEIQSSNSLTVFDEFNNANDWIELYNAGSSPVNLNNFFLSDDINDPYKWKFPGVIIEPNQYQLVFASGLDIYWAYVHTNFKISSQGEDLVLTEPRGAQLDHLPPVSIPNDFSWGRYPDASTNLVYFSKPTPKASNVSDPVVGFTYEEPVFSHNGGFYTSGFDLTITTIHPNAEIRYTLDGSEPDKSSTLYTNPIHIDSRAGDPNVLSMIEETSVWWFPPAGEIFKSTVVRAKLFIPDTLALKSETHTFFVDGGIFTRYNMPVVSIVTDSLNLFDYERGIYVKGKIYDDWVAANPDDTVTWWIPANYFERGDAWERPAHIEFFEKNGDFGFSGDIGIRIHGGASRLFRQKSLRLYFRDKYGDEYVDYPVFPELTTRAGGFPLTRFKRLMLRNSGNDFESTLFRDGMIHTLVSHMQNDYQAIRPAVIFLNGEFWGIHNFRERQDRHYTESHYHIDADDVHKLETMGFVSEGPEDANIHFYEMYVYAENHNLSQTAAYDYMKTKMDMNSFIDHQVVQIYIRNTDWPGNNISFWRKNTSQYISNALYGQDGRWRWQLFDTDFGFGWIDEMLAPLHNTLEYATDGTQTEWPNPAWSTLLLRKLLENNNFRNDFINRFADHMNTTFKPHRVIEVIDSMQMIYFQNMPENIHRWHSPDGNINIWQNNVNIMRYFANQRPQYMTQHVIDMWGLPGTAQVQLDVSDPAHGFIKISSVDINENTVAANNPVYPWEGKYFKAIPIPVKAIPKPGYMFVEWEGTGNTNPLIEVTLADNLYLKALFQVDPDYNYHPLVYINELMASNVQTIDDELGEYDDWIELYNPNADTIDIAGFYITDNIQTPFKHRIPDGSHLTKIPPGGFLLLWADNQPEQGPLHLSFKLSASGEAVIVFSPDSYVPVDSVSFGEQTDDISYGRYPDGNINWIFFDRPTPGASNVIPPEEEEPNDEFFVYPSPVNDVLFLSMERDVEIFSITGVLVFSAQSVSSIDVRNLASGIYFIKTSEKEIKRFMKF